MATKLIAEFYRLRNDGEEIVAVITWDGKKLDVTKGADSAIIKEVKNEGIFGRYGRYYDIDDGEEFIRELPFAYHGSYLWCSLREE